ncbi:MAG: S-layer family protein [Cyanobacteria bacterium P01_A01_bin.84]
MNIQLNWQQKLVLFSSIVFYATPVEAQITPDNTLGTEASRVTPNVLINGENADRIDGGAQRGSNLFQSFSQFNIENQQRVYFANPSGVKNILTRVTGGNKSNILGTLGVDGNANLFLINPSGILFGDNARLDLGGSFVGTTANGVQFGEQGLFSATNPEATPLLTVNPNALFFNQINQNAGIQNNGILSVSAARSLALVGGDVGIDNGGLFALGGNIHIGAVKENGIISLNQNDNSFDNNSNNDSNNNFSLQFPKELGRGNISLSNNSGLIVTGVESGNITITGKDLNIDNSSINAGIFSNFGSADTQAGDITLDAKGVVDIDNSLVLNVLSSGAVGNTGNVNINARRLNVNNSAQVGALNFGEGNTGNLNFKVIETVELNGGNNGNFGGLFAQLGQNGKGTAGDIFLETGNLDIRNGAVIGGGNFGNGSAGSVNITANDSVSLNDGAADSSIFNNVNFNAIGNTGGINIITGSLSITNGAQIRANIFGEGSSEKINISARDRVTLEGEDNLGFPSGIFSTIENGGKGNTGGIDINTNFLLLNNRSQISSVTQGEGNAENIIINAQEKVDLLNSIIISEVSDQEGIGDGGNIKIKTGSLTLKNGSSLLADTENEGNAGNIEIEARDSVVLEGKGPGAFNNRNITVSSQISTTAESNAIGEGGDIKVSTGLLSIKDRGFIDASTFAQGNAGNVIIDTNDILLQDGAQISGSTFGSGQGGTLNINTSKSIEIIGQSADKTPSGLGSSSSVNSTGDAGELRINTQEFSLKNGAGVFVRSLGTGNAGILNIDAKSIRLDNQVSLNANTRSANADKEQATINLNSNFLVLRRNSNITTNATGENVIGGNININSDVIAGLENSDINANSTDFRGGRVKIDTQGIFGIQPRNVPTLESDITATGANPNLSGNTQIEQPDVEPTQGIIELPAQFEDKSSQIGQVCPKTARDARNIGTFTVTGRGSLSPSPLKPLAPKANLSRLATLDDDVDDMSGTRVKKEGNVEKSKVERIVEAQGIIKNTDGNIYLVAKARGVTPTSHRNKSVCSIHK